MMKHEKQTIGTHTLYLGDCADILPTLGRFDLLLTDPPYGIDFLNGAGGGRKAGQGGWKIYDRLDWDNARPNGDVISSMVSMCGTSIVWGGNYFTDVLPPSMQWLIWDKGQRGFSLADCEMAWSSQNRAIRVFDYSRGSAVQDGKQHPTQKPVALMAWCIEQCKTNPQTILDPFMGSGTTGVAAVQLGRQFVGIERERQYFDIACQRIEQAVAQGQLFAPATPERPNTASLFT